MWEIKDEIWEKQIGVNKQIGSDFSGREIHYDDFQNYSSPYGWTLISFGDDEYLVVHLKTEEEFPTNIVDDEENEFVINDRLFNITKNSNGEWDINSIEYDEEFIPNDEVSYSYENANDYNDYSSDAIEAFSFKNNNSFNNDNDQMIQNQIEQIEQLKKQLSYERTQQINLQEQQEFLRRENSEKLAHEQYKQKKEIELLENQIRLQKERTQQIEIERNNKKISELEEQLARTQTINARTLENFQIEKNINNVLGDISNSYNRTSSFNSTISSNKNIINDLSKKINEQTMQINSLKMDKKHNAKRMEDIKKIKEKINAAKKNEISITGDALRQWNSQFGDATLGVDFAGHVVSKDKFKQNIEGGWDLDFYDLSNSTESFVASIKTINERAGRQSFSLQNKNYFISNKSGKWEIKEVKNGMGFEYSTENIKDIASKIKPIEEEEFNGTYETYSSLLVNLNHFPLIHLAQFETFLRKALSGISFFKELFIYSNERLYKKNETNISSYARIFFKTNSTRNDIEILLTSLSLKKGMVEFINNFKGTNDFENISFSMFLMSHQKRLKFIHAQTNFELLRAHPIPARIPLNRLIIDKEYNSILKFHEHNLWKQLKPYAIDWNGNVYYVCEINIDHLNVLFN